MTIEVNHLIVPATDKETSARFLAGILGLPMAEAVSHFRPVRVGPVTLDYDNATDIRPLHIAFLVDDATFEAAHERLVDGGVPTYADPGRSRPGQINHRHGGRGVYFDDPDRHLFELMTAADRADVGSRPVSDTEAGHG
jgi:catechol 2,3-dioxygenase-like lactoylglutathione lyase family enzyme